MVKKILSVCVVVLLLVTMMFTGCTGKKTTKNETNTNSSQQQADKGQEEKPVHLTLAHWGSDFDEEVYKERANLVKNKYPNITVKIMYIPADYDSKMQTMLAADEAPDIMQVAEASNSYASKNVFTPLDDYIKKYNIELNERYGKQVVNQYVYKGKLYAMPDRSGAMVLYYNKDMFDEAGVSYPTKDWTWDDFLDACKKLTKKNDKGEVIQFGFAAGGWWPWWMSFMYQNGGRILDESLEKVVVNSKENIEAINFYVDLVHKYHVAPSADDYARFGLNDGQPDPLFAQGHCAMNITGSWNIGSLRKVEGLNWDMAPLWRGKERGTVAFGSALAIPKAGKNVEAAFKAVEFLTSEEGQMPIASRAQDVPANKKVQASDAFLKPEWAKDRNLNFMAFADSADAIFSPPLHPKWNEIQRICGDYLSVVFQQGGDSSEALKKIEADLKAIIEE